MAEPVAPAAEAPAQARTQPARSKPKRQPIPRPKRAQAVTTAKPVERMDPEDLIYGHALAAYLIEGFPDKAGGFLRVHGVSQPFRDTIDTVFGLTVPKFVERFHRWLREVT